MHRRSHGAAEARWLGVTLDDGALNAPTPRPEGEGAFTKTVDAANTALDRIGIPADIRWRISKMLTPGSSMAITDDGISRETVDRGTDFVVLTR